MRRCAVSGQIATVDSNSSVPLQARMMQGWPFGVPVDDVLLADA